MRAEFKCDADAARAEAKIYFSAGERQAGEEIWPYLTKANLTASLAQLTTIVEREAKFAGIRAVIINLYYFCRRAERNRVSVETRNGEVGGGESFKEFIFRF